MELTKNYNGADIGLTEALSSYHYFRDDARFGGWQSYLQRSQDFINFCCHMHIWEMLSARGGKRQNPSGVAMGNHPIRVLMSLREPPGNHPIRVLETIQDEASS